MSCGNKIVSNCFKHNQRCEIFPGQQVYPFLVCLASKCLDSLGDLRRDRKTRRHSVNQRKQYRVSIGHTSTPQVRTTRHTSQI